MARSKGSKGQLGSRPGEVSRPETVTLKITLPREVARLLKVEAFGRDVSLGRVVEDLVKAAPKRFSIIDRGSRSQGVEGPSHPSIPGGSSARGDHGTLGLVSEVG